MPRGVTEQTKEKMRKDERYQKKREELLQEWEECLEGGKQREWFEKTLIAWIDTREGRRVGRYEGGAERELAYIDVLQEHILPEARDEEYAELLLKVQNTHNIPAYVVILCRDILSRKLYLDRNTESVKKLLDWCAKQVDGDRGKVLILPNGEKDAETGIQFFAESIILTGEVKKQETLSEMEKSVLLIAGAELIGRCVRSGMLVRERAEDYMDYALSHGDRSILPVLIALKYKEEQ